MKEECGMQKRKIEECEGRKGVECESRKSVECRKIKL
jgi:hypothetical protein